MVEQSFSARDTSLMEAMDGDLNIRHGKSPFVTKSLRTIDHDPNSILEALDQQNIPGRNGQSQMRSINESPSQPSNVGI